jgi:hypothetical protein
MFRMNIDCFDKLHDLLVGSYGLKSTPKMTSVEALGMFLWMCASQQSIIQAENRLIRSPGTVCRKFEEVLASVCKLAADIIRPKDPEFRYVHPSLQSTRFFLSLITA